ncbi:MAG: hypothetical protein IPL35_16910 [Sphingobacteriales bacterium]|nr:hypothetical protein [Sphingobacteriales bacterium]
MDYICFIDGITSCGFSTPGQEAIYEFTPTTTGTHNLQITAAAGVFIDYFYKVAGTCDETGWTCIGDLNSVATVSFGPLTAGTTYWILLDSETATAISHTWQINCPAPPPLACGETSDPYCYSTANTLEAVSTNICPNASSDIITLTFLQGVVEDTYDELYVYSGATGTSSDPQVPLTNYSINSYYGTAGDLTGLTVTAINPGDCVSVYVNTDDLVNCSDSVYNPIIFSVACPACPDLSSAAPMVEITNSTCSTVGGTPSGGSINAPATPCPSGSSIQYSLTNNGMDWSASSPAYDQDGPAQTVYTRCLCGLDGSTASPASSLATVPGTCPVPALHLVLPTLALAIMTSLPIMRL